MGIKLGAGIKFGVGAPSSTPIRLKGSTPVLPPTYAVAAYGGASSINEGGNLIFNVTTTDVGNGTTLYWTANNVSTSNADFSPYNGSFTITSNAGSFNFNLSADLTTEGSETFTVSVRTISISGTEVATSTSITVNDTSTTPVRYSYYFQDSGNNFSNWVDVPISGAHATALSSGSQTREMWIKRIAGSSGRNVGIFRLIGGDTGTIYLNNGNIKVYNGGDIISVSESYVTYNTWVHVALTLSGGTAKLWIGGVQRASVSASFSGSSGPVNIGGASDMSSVGYLSNVRVSNIARYTETFIPPTAPFEADANTVLLTAKSSTFIDESSSGLTVTTQGSTVTQISTQNPFS
jgi:hypothetical protein